VVQPKPINETVIHRLDWRDEDAAQAHEAFRAHYSRGEEYASGGESGGAAGNRGHIDLW